MQRVMAVTKLGEDLELVKCELPVPKGDEVLIRTTFAGLCHSDLHQIDGYFDLGGDEKLNVGARKKLPFCVGHEIEGEVIAVGKNAKGKVNIGKYTIIGSGSVILPRVNIVDNCRIGALSLVNKNIIKKGIYSGIPCKKMKK